MDKRRVLLLCVQSLLCESLEKLLRREKDVELIGPWDLDAQELARLSDELSDVVLVVGGESEDENVASLIAGILRHYPDVPVIRVG